MHAGKSHVIDGCYYLLQIALAGFLFKLEGTLRKAKQTRTVTDNYVFPPLSSAVVRPCSLRYLTKYKCNLCEMYYLPQEHF